MNKHTKETLRKALIKAQKNLFEILSPLRTEVTKMKGTTLTEEKLIIIRIKDMLREAEERVNTALNKLMNL